MKRLKKWKHKLQKEQPVKVETQSETLKLNNYEKAQSHAHLTDYEKEHPHAHDQHPDFEKTHHKLMEKIHHPPITPLLNEKEFGKLRDYDPKFEGPVGDRSCTDVICLGFFITCNIFWAGVMYYAFTNGILDRITHPTDTSGSICGQGTAVDRPNLFYFDLTQCVLPTSLITGCSTISVCVANCPSESFSFLEYTGAPDSGPINTSRLFCSPDVNKSHHLATLISQEKCASYYFPSGVISRRCFPGKMQMDDGTIQSIFQTNETQPNLTTEDGRAISLADALKGSTWLNGFIHTELYLNNFWHDIKVSWPVLLIGYTLSITLSMLWILCLRWLACPMVWFAIASFFTVLVYAIYYCISMYMQLYSVRGADLTFTWTVDFTSYFANQNVWLAFGVILFIVLTLLTLILIFLRSRISIAIALLGEGSRCVGSITSALFFPLTPFVLQFIVVGSGVITGLYLFSTGNPVGMIVGSNNMTVAGARNNDPCDPLTFAATHGNSTGARCSFLTYEKSKNLPLLQVYNFFMLFWAMYFVDALGEISLAGAFGSYYWTWDKENDLPHHPIFYSLKRACRYHLGTIAFGSLIITIVRIMRYVITFIHRKLKHINHPVAATMLKVFSCCFWCLEKFLKFINENAYIVTAIYGKSFYVAAKEVYFLLMRNLVRVVVLDSVVDFLILMGKLSIVTALGILSFGFYSGKLPGTENYVPNIHYIYAPILAICLGSYIIASLFFDVYEMAIDTLFLCFLEDVEQNDGTPDKPFFMPKQLMEILGKKNALTEKANSPEDMELEMANI